jgi:hypothetical protein
MSTRTALVGVAFLLVLGRFTYAQTPPGPIEPTGLTPASLDGSSGQVSSGTSFNPAISVIPDGVYYGESGGGLDLLGQVDGFGHGHAHGEETGHSHGLDLSRGFNLRETEVTFNGAVDPYFDLWAILAVGADGVEIEESYVQTRRLPAGLKAKFGKFYSEIGYVNKQHPHQWDFVDQNLAYQLVLGGSLNETGLQLTWLPKLPFYLLLGAEALQGGNESFASQVGPTEEQPLFADKPGPRLFTGFAKLAPNVGYKHALQIGLFAGRSNLHQQEWEAEHGHASEHAGAPAHQEAEHEHAATPEFLEGKSWVFGTDWVYKYDSPRAYGAGDLQVQAEYLYRKKDLSVLTGPHTEDIGAARRFAQDGFYAQTRYGFAPRWTAALRFDMAGITNRLDRGDEPGESWQSSKRASLALAFSPTEFSRIRVQASRSDLSVGGERRKFNQIYVQYQMSLGVHGAHRF